MQTDNTYTYILVCAHYPQPCVQPLSLFVYLCLSVCLSVYRSVSPFPLSLFCIFVGTLYNCINLLFVLNCVCSIARTGCWIDPNGPNATSLEY